MAINLPTTISLSDAPRVDLCIDWLTFNAAQPVKTLAITTHGMLNFGQKELVLCLKHYSNEYINTAIELFRLILGITASGQRVDVNGLTEFGADGIFNNSRFTGIGYARSHSIEPVLETLGVKNNQVLSMVLLTAGEVAVMKNFGLARILSRLCADSRYFPYPLWNDMERPETIGKDDIEKCYLQNFLLHPGVIAMREADTVTVYFDRNLAPTLAQTFAAKPAAIFSTELAPASMDGLLVWQPESEHVSVNTPHLFAVNQDRLNSDDTVHSLAGCYILIGHDPKNDTQGVDYSEDGFFVTLDLQGWDSFMTTIHNQQPCVLDGRDGSFHFGVGWIG